MNHSKETEPEITQEEQPPPDKSVRAKIRKLEIMACSGLWALALFTAVSIGAFRNFSFLPGSPADFQALLGPSPPTNLINWALTIYGFSAMILILTRMTNPGRPHGAFLHLGYLTAFYGFYYFANELPENFWAVFAAGMTILSLHSYHIWNHFQELIQQEKADLVKMHGRNR